MEHDACANGAFNPPLWRQRRTFICDQLLKYRAISVLDYGCGEGSVLAFLIPNVHDDVHITKLAGLDLDADVLQETIARCEPWDSDYRDLRETPLQIDIYQGSIDQPDSRLMGFDAIVCSEVIEHVYDDVLEPFFGITLGLYRPKILIVTTPNAEYNVFFDELRCGTFRHDDHKFEWPRHTFEDWCNDGGRKYGYSTEFHGIGLLNGKKDCLDKGHSTQACVFVRQDDHEPVVIIEKQSHTLLKHIDFPYYDEPPLSDHDMVQIIEKYIEMLCQAECCNGDTESHASLEDTSPSALEWCVDWSNEAMPETVPVTVEPPKRPVRWTRVPLHLPISSLWSILQVRQVCKQRHHLSRVLLATGRYEQDGDHLIVHQSFPMVEQDD
ncbi:uncharacterized protein BYT42DRAFT_610802 [Radiomyces spectabilis]|uniref:uncharacterized protein n=1 Tax=Radiomyces spectabilis TaxID=64574 RepID=UPI00221E5FDB|nr:uncharacterized protein BYT42DRAFT_610802 [Radiomyces spectabilis]KAI8391592.1 hypothetical protein BYT42DRAFT_610802 [Radiomyces spectabilis]